MKMNKKLRELYEIRRKLRVELELRKGEGDLRRERVVENLLDEVEEKIEGLRKLGLEG